MARGLLSAAVLTWCTVTAANAEVIRPGHPDVDPSRLPWGTAKLASVRIADGDSTPLNTTEQTIEPVRWRGEDAIRIASLHASAEGDTTRGEIVVRAHDLSLLHHSVRAASDSMSVSCSGDYVTGWVVLPGQPVRLLDVRVDGPVFPPDGPAAWLLCALPLAEGYTADIARFDPWSGGMKEYALEVLGQETVTLDGDDVTCWKVDTGPMGPPGYRGVRWVHGASRHVLQGSLRGPEGRPWYRSQAVSIEPLEQRDLPVTAEDLRILERAAEILGSPAAWDREDDRRCEESDTTFSLFCALQRACVEVLGEYQHRRAALQEVRFAIEEVSGHREFEHRLMDFNNTATFEEVQSVLRLAREEIERRLTAGVDE